MGGESPYIRMLFDQFVGRFPKFVASFKIDTQQVGALPGGFIQQFGDEFFGVRRDDTIIGIPRCDDDKLGGWCIDGSNDSAVMMLRYELR